MYKTPLTLKLKTSAPYSGGWSNDDSLSEHASREKDRSHSSLQKLDDVIIIGVLSLFVFVYNIKESSLSHGPFRAVGPLSNGVGLPPPFFCLASLLSQLLSLRASVFSSFDRGRSCHDNAFLFGVWLHPFSVHKT